MLTYLGNIGGFFPTTFATTVNANFLAGLASNFDAAQTALTGDGLSAVTTWEGLAATQFGSGLLTTGIAGFPSAMYLGLSDALTGFPEWCVSACAARCPPRALSL